MDMTSVGASTARAQFAAFNALDGRTRGWRALLPFMGPAVIASVGYMDPGNIATNLQAGSTYGYELLWVVLLANLVAMLFQAMSAKIGIVTGRSLAEVCRDEFPRPLVMSMWLASEVGAMATDVAEFLGGALGISLLLHISLMAGMCATGVLSMVLLRLDRNGFRPLEIAIAALVGAIGLSYVFELLIAPPDWKAVAFHMVVPALAGKSAVALAVGIIGATIMPHTLFLHSGLTQTRTPPRDDSDRRRIVRFSNKEIVIALGVAGFVNLAMVTVAATVFNKTHPGISDLSMAYHMFEGVLGGGAAMAFIVSLIASGLASSTVGTMAGQVIMKGFVHLQIPVWVRRVVTIVPSFVVACLWNPVDAIVWSQVVLSFVLPIPLIALVVLSARQSLMGSFASSRFVVIGAGLATLAIVALNGVLIAQALST